MEIPESSSSEEFLNNNGGKRSLIEEIERTNIDPNKRMLGPDGGEDESDEEPNESPKRIKIERLEHDASPIEESAPAEDSERKITENGIDDDAPSSSIQIKIKEEPADTNENINENGTGVSNLVKNEFPDEFPTVSNPLLNDSLGTSEAEVKVETPTVDADDQPSGSGVINPSNIVPAAKVETSDASSTTSRISCRFGVRCYRRNPMHRQEEAHPGDSDYKRPKFPPPPKGTPDCPYGDSCYRRNPVHFQQYSHPPDTDFQQNYKAYRLRVRQQQQNQTNTNGADGNSSELDDYDLDDPFIDDSDDPEYLPSDNTNDYDEDLDYDECDKAEE